MVKPVTALSAVLVAPVVVLSACTTNQPSKESPSPSPSGTTTTTAAPAGALTTQLKTANGIAVANATFDFANGFGTVTVETVAPGILTPGFHGLHIHSVGKCEANSVSPTGGPPGDFNSAGGHFQAPGHTRQPASGDLTSLEVRNDGSAKLVTTTDAVTAADLLAGEKTALIIHEGPDNFGNIPTRYTQENGAPGPDQETMSTGDSGKRIACGVIGSTAATATTTTVTTTAPTTTATTTVTTTGATTTAPTSESSGTGTTTVTAPSSSAVTTTTETVPPTNPAPGG